MGAIRSTAPAHMTDQVASYEWLKKLISYNTVSDRSNLDLINECKETLEKLGFTTQLFYNEEKNKANLYATIGPKDVPGIILSGHTDVVPIDGQSWDTNPFELVEKDGNFFGRGTCDMKGFVAVCMAFADKFAQADLKIPVHLAFSYDEEVGCVGVHSLTDYLSTLSLKPFACFVGEPTMMEVVRKHKGIQAVFFDVQGFECHSSLVHQGVNAVEYASEMVCKMRSMKNQRAKEGPFDHGFEPPYTSVHCGVMQGGTARNIVPKACSVQGEWRYVPAENPADLLNELQSRATELNEEMKSIHPDTGITIRIPTSGPPLDTQETAKVVELAQQFSGTEKTINVSYMTEAGLFSEAGVPTVVIGPGSIAQAHKPNEFCSVEQIKRCEAFMEKLVEYVQQ